MNLSNDLISQFVKETRDKSKEKTETVVYGTVKIVDGETYAQLDGSELLTPVNATATTKEGDRVTVMIKNHTATVTGNITSPSATNQSVKEVGDKVDQFNIILADKITTEQLSAVTGTIDNLKTKLASISKLEAVDAEIESLVAKFADIEYITATDIQAVAATIESLEVTFGTFTDVSIEDLDALKADIQTLRGYTADFTYVSAEVLKAMKADIKNLDVGRLTAEQADIRYAKIGDLAATNADVVNLNADVADINTLIFGSAAGTSISTTFANAIIAVLANAQIKSAMIDSLSADKITAGSIKTNLVDIVSEDGKMTISDETIQISDGTRARVQIGKDASNDYSITVWDVDGNVMFSHDGITDNAIKDAIIRNDMIAQDANISAEKIDIGSLFKVINNDGSNTLKSSKILIDADNQTLDIAFENMTTKLSDVEKAANQNAEDMAKVIKDFNNDIEGLQTQIDGSITTWFYEVAPTLSNEPAVNWTTVDQKNIHLGDLYYDTFTGYCYRWQVKNNEYSWQRITDTDVTKALADAAAAQDTADQKRRVFHEKPTTPYEKGDLWVQGDGGDILRCQVTKTDRQEFSQTDWVKASKYTDDTKANENAQQIISQGSRITAVEGKFESKVWQTDINNATGEMTNKYNNLSQDLGNFKSEVSTTYTKLSDFNNLQIGGRNLIRNSASPVVFGSAFGITGSITDEGYLHIVADSGNSGWFYFKFGDSYEQPTVEDTLREGDEFTISFTMRSSDSTQVPEVYIKSGMGYYFMSGTISSEWSTVWYTGTWKDANPIQFHLNFADAPGTYEIKNAKLEKGNKATDWTPAPEDMATIEYTESITSEIDQKADTISASVKSTFAGASDPEIQNGSMIHMSDISEVEKTAKVMIEVSSSNLLDPTKVDEDTNVRVSNGVVTQITADTNPSAVFKCQTWIGSIFVDNVTSSILVTTGRIGVSFEKTAEITRIRFGLNGSVTDTMVSVNVSDLPTGTYFISVDFTNATQGSVSWKDMMINKGPTELPYEPYVDPTTKGYLTRCGANFLNPINVIAGSNTAIIDGVVTQMTADTDNSPIFKCVTYNDNTLINLTTSANRITEVGRCGAIFEKTSEVNKLIFGLNGSSIDTIVSLNISYLPNDTYFISVDFTNITQGSVSWKDMMINRGPTALPYEPFTEKRFEITLDGTPYDIPLLSPNTTIFTDIQGANITCQREKNPFRSLETSIQILKDSFRTIVDGQTGKTIMTQTENGWEFDTSNIYSTINSAAQAVKNDLINEDIKNANDNLTKYIEEQSGLTSSVRIGVTPDEAKDPCVIINQVATNDDGTKIPSDFRICITAKYIGFYENDSKLLWITNKRINADSIVVNEELNLGNAHVFKKRIVKNRIHTSISYIGRKGGS